MKSSGPAVLVYFFNNDDDELELRKLPAMLIEGVQVIAAVNQSMLSAAVNQLMLSVTVDRWLLVCLRAYSTRVDILVLNVGLFVVVCSL